MFENVWVTGAGGLIGSHLVKCATLPFSRNVIGLSRAELDLTDFSTVREAFRRDRPQLVIHCAAISKTTECQSNPSMARRVNIEVTTLLNDLAENIPFIMFSSDLVFDGKKGNYDEAATVNPLNLYAETKVAAEGIVLANPKHTVVRTSLNGGVSPKGDRGFNEELRKAWHAGKTLRLFVDEFRSPMAAQVTALAVLELASLNHAGLYHIAGSERLSRWQIGQLLAARWPQLQPKLEQACVAEYQGAPRSPDTSLNCAKVQALLSFPLPGLSRWLVERPNETF